MDEKQKDKEILRHMENRTQWHQKDVEEIEALRNKVSQEKAGGVLTEKQIEQNKVKHEH